MAWATAVSRGGGGQRGGGGVGRRRPLRVQSKGGERMQAVADDGQAVADDGSR